MWIFGYGSLVWKVDFPYVKKVVGYVKGYERRFWQASIDHRGVPGKPGRVVTLVPAEDPGAKVWGVAYEITGTSETKDSVKQLDDREKRYEKRIVSFYQSESQEGLDFNICIECVAYIANPRGPLFLGHAPAVEIAQQVVSARGPSGENAEYVLLLAEFMKEHAPNERDSHLFELQNLVQELLLSSA